MPSASELPVEIPKKCLAGVIKKFGEDFELAMEQVDVPEPGPDDVLIRLSVTGICYSDIHCMIGDLPLPRLDKCGVRSPGHEGVGVVVKVGANVKGWQIGDRAGIKPIRSVCFNCHYCWNMLETVCPKATFTGITHTGTYQSYMSNPAIYTTRLPDGVNDVDAAPIMCAGSTMYQCIEESGLKTGDTLAILGAGGGVGSFGVQIAKAFGYRVIGLDAGEQKRTHCMTLGCESYVDVTATNDAAAEVIKATDGQGAHGVIVTAGNKAAYQNATNMVRTGGIVLCVGLPPTGTAFAGADPNTLIFKRLTIKGSFVGSMSSTEKCLELVQRGLVKPMVDVYPADRLPEAVDKLRKGQVVAGRCAVKFE